ncbi:hypothetical protein [Chryseobacterium shandongense]|uniref:hypothetical protein n=1 Tax=Chryseobacterium shandongense TaxID=1493872 RepID=UPI000F4F54A4|nr:hypothetical protein [Chryseobacterium shandongense]AZA56846.1 hypothetical protein EG350_06525 [Chryseobacterium shandongense]
MLKDHSNRNAKDINKLLAFRDSQAEPPKTKQNKTKQNKKHPLHHYRVLSSKVSKESLGIRYS